jgi:hypothetical protein
VHSVPLGAVSNPIFSVAKSHLLDLINRGDEDAVKAAFSSPTIWISVNSRVDLGIVGIN